MSTSFSYRTPQTSISSIDMAVHLNSTDDQNSTSFHSTTGTFSKRNRRNNSGIHLQTLAVSQQTTTTDENGSMGQLNTDLKVDDDEQILSSYYDHNRMRQEKLMLILNIFRLSVILVLAPIIYFLV